jgi:hypothetical protein
MIFEMFMAQMYNTITSRAVKMFAVYINGKASILYLEVTVYLLTFATGQKETEAGNGNRSLLF